MLDFAPPPVRMTDEQFDRLLQYGGASQLGRVELRRGALVQMSPQYLPHGRTKFWFAKKLEAAVSAAALSLVVDSEVSVRFGPGFRPLPNVTLWTGGPLAGMIPGELVKLCVEVSDETLADDLGSKREDYSAAGLAEYWVIDVKARALHRFSELVGGDYQRRDIIRAGEMVASAAIPSLSLLFDPPQG